MLIDLHTHTVGISKCCKLPTEEILRNTKEAGLDGIVLTNHYSYHHMREGEDFPTLSKRFVREFHDVKAAGDAMGVRVFFGIEVSMANYKGVHVLVYGVDEDFLLRNPFLCDATQEALYQLVKSNGGVMVQAHPYRKNIDRLLDPAYLDGIELSCHPKYDGTHQEELTAIAQKHGLLLTAGGDYHGDTYRTHCGIYLPETVTNGVELGAYLSSANEIRLCVHEVGESAPHDVTYTRNHP